MTGHDGSDGTVATAKTQFLPWLTGTRLRRLNVGLLAVLLFVVVCGNYRFTVAGSTVRMMRHPENFVFVPVLVSLLIFWRERRWMLRITWREKVLGFYLLFTLAGLLYSSYPRSSLAEIKQLLRMLGLAVALAWSVRDRRDMKILLAGFFLGSLVNVGVGVYQYLWTEDPSILHKVRGTWQDKNYFGGQLELSIAYLAAGLFYYARQVRWALVLGAALAAHAVVLIMTLARSSTLATALAVVAFGVFMRAQVALRILAGVVVVVAGVLLVVPARPIVDRFASMGLEDAALRERFDAIWPAVIRRIEREGALLGTGYGGNVNPKRADGSREVPVSGQLINTHNVVLQVVLVQGVVGLAFWVAFCFFAIQLAFRLLRGTRDPLTRALGGGTLIWVAIGWIRGIIGLWPFSGPIRFDLCAVMFLTLAVLADNTRACAASSGHAYGAEEGTGS
jgi:O-antigen ligase